MKPKDIPVITAPADPAELESQATAAALDQLGAELAGTEAELSASQAAASAAEFKSKAESWAFIPAMFGKVVSVALPELQDVYTEKACLNWGEAMVPVADKYGWTDPAVSVEMSLIIATIPLALPTGIAVKKYLDQRKHAPMPNDAPQESASKPYIMQSLNSHAENQSSQ